MLNLIRCCQSMKVLEANSGKRLFLKCSSDARLSPNRIDVNPVGNQRCEYQRSQPQLGHSSDNLRLQQQDGSSDTKRGEHNK